MVLLGLSISGLLLGAFLFHRRQTREAVQVHLVVPDGFRGLFALQVSADTEANHRDTGNRYIYQIPQAGFLLISEKDPIFQWHRLSAEYASGAPLAVDQVPDKDAVQLYSLSTDQHGNSYYLVGTAAEKEQFFRSTNRMLGGVASPQR